jgi:peptidoglycan/LPS O-acetylase OafA/YrhL
MSENRILIFDVLRIPAIIGIVMFHIGEMIGKDFSFGAFGVIIFIFTSGCVLELGYGKKIWGAVSKFDYRSFIETRILRIYPAYWLAIVLALIISPYARAGLNLSNLLKTVSGFYPIFATKGDAFIGGVIEPVGWFVCAIMLLYLLYPMLSKFLKENGIQALIIILVVSAFSTMTLPAGDILGGNASWFPLSTMAEFALGIYVVQAGLYLKTVNTSRIVRFASDLSFPVFLVHFPVLIMLTPKPNIDYLTISIYVGIVLVLAVLVYLFDVNVRKLCLGLKLTENKPEIAERP